MPVPGAVPDLSTVAVSSTTVTTADGYVLPLYVARPAAPAGPLPGLVVVVHAGGVDDHMRDVARRFAAQGFLTVAPEIFARQGGPPDLSDGEALMRALNGMSDAEAITDLSAAVAWIRAQPDSSSRVAGIGFCMGGRLSLLLATQPDVLDRAIDCWGGRVTRRTLAPDERRPEVVVERIDRLSCPLLGVFGADDANPNAQDVAELRAALERHGKDHRIVVYEGAGHALFADTRPSYRDAQAHLAWDEFLAFLAPLR